MRAIQQCLVDRAELRTVHVRCVTREFLTDSLVQAKFHPVTDQTKTFSN